MECRKCLEMVREAAEKLGMDFATRFRLCAGARCAMGDEAEQEHRRQWISAAFALVTAKLEDAATIAVEGQGRHSIDQLRTCAEQIAGLAGGVATIAGALAASLGESER